MESGESSLGGAQDPEEGIQTIKRHTSDTIRNGEEKSVIIGVLE